MIYKNSLKIMMTNFSLVSRILVFLVFHFAIVFGLSYMFLLPIIHLMNSSGFFTNAQNYYFSFLQTLNLQQAFADVASLMNQFNVLLNNNLSTVVFPLLAFFVTFAVVGSFLSNMYHMAISNSLYYSMSNNVKMKFLPSFVSTLGQNLKYSLFALLTKLPLTIIIVSALILSFQLLTVGGAVALFAPLLIMLGLFLLLSAKTTLFYGWVPAIVVLNKGILFGLDKSLKLTLRKLKKVYANSFYMVLTIFVVNVFAALVTFGASLLLTIPMSILLMNAFSMVVFYSNYGMRYYVDEFNVIVPAKLEHTEPLSDIKYII